MSGCFGVVNGAILVVGWVAIGFCILAVVGGLLIEAWEEFCGYVRNRRWRHR